MTIPSELETYILSQLRLSGFTRENAADYNDRIAYVRKQMYRLSEDFAAGANSESDYADAYFAYNFPMNVMKTILTLNELSMQFPQIFHVQEKLSVLDIGCGDGAGLIGSYHALHKTHGLLLTGIDASATMLRRCHSVMTWLMNRD